MTLNAATSARHGDISDRDFWRLARRAASWTDPFPRRSPQPRARLRGNRCRRPVCDRGRRRARRRRPSNANPRRRRGRGCRTQGAAAARTRARGRPRASARQARACRSTLRAGAAAARAPPLAPDDQREHGGAPRRIGRGRGARLGRSAGRRALGGARERAPRPARRVRRPRHTDGFAARDEGRAAARRCAPARARPRAEPRRPPAAARADLGAHARNVERALAAPRQRRLTSYLRQPPIVLGDDRRSSAAPRACFVRSNHDDKLLRKVVLMVASARRRWWALALLSVVQFMVVLDIAIVNVALPSIQVDLGFSQENLQWVISAYALVFGGFLLLGGRAADLLGRRRVFLGGLVVFTAGSLLAGLAWSEASLIGARTVQGLGAAIISPAALSILTTTFREGRERNIALGVWGAVGGFGAAAGVLLGGILTDALSWEWIFFVNVPVGVAAFVIAPFLLTESRDARVSSFDVPGAVLVTAGLSSVVYAITKAGTDGWLAGPTLAFFAASVLLLAAFVAWEVRHAEPLMRFGIFRISTVTGANVAGFILGTAMFSMFLMLTLYMQQVLGYSAMKTGVAYLAVAGTAIIWSAVAAQLVTRVGVKPVLAAGMAFLTAGLVLFTQVPVDGSYVTDLLPGFLLLGIGIGFAFVPISIAALAGVQPAEAGLASGLINTSQQIGGALGIAALSTIASSNTDDALASGTALPSALVDGFTAAFVAGAIIAALGILASLTLIRRHELEQPVPAVEPASEPTLEPAA